MTVLERLRDKANSLPQEPGVYIMKNSDSDVIYVGKSKKLKNRVSSYFVGQSHSYKTAKMVSHVRDFDYIVCKTEIEALTLENVLIDLNGLGPSKAENKNKQSTDIIDMSKRIKG